MQDDFHGVLNRAAEASPARIIKTCEPLLCCDEVWENAYLRFETTAEEIRKFRDRLQFLGLGRCSRDSQVVELFCGRGNGLIALSQLGFVHIEGVDLSERLLLQFQGNATLYVADCRKLPFEDGSRDIVIVQGGLHHLPNMPGDLLATVQECHRVLRPGGQLVVVEPWMTLFLKTVHWLSERWLLRRAWDKLDAFATMTEREHQTYYQWHSLKPDILKCLNAGFHSERQHVRFGKLYYVGRRG